MDLLSDGDLDPAKNNLNAQAPSLSYGVSKTHNMPDQPKTKPDAVTALMLAEADRLNDKVGKALAKSNEHACGMRDEHPYPPLAVAEPAPTEIKLGPGLPLDMAKDVLEHAARAHSRHSPSTLENKAKCEGWFNQEGRDTTAADRGSLGHLMVEKNNFGMAPDDPDLTNAALKCRDFLTRFKGLHMTELALPIQDQKGHLDHLYLNEDNSADLVDLKFAKNAYPADSAQFHAYMVGVWDAFPYIQKITVWVLHPFLDHVDVEVFYRRRDYDRLNAVIRKIIENATNPNPDNFHIGKQCAWCGRASKCKAWAQLGVEIANRANKDGEKYELPKGGRLDGEDIDPETLAVLWRIAPLIKTVSEGWRALALHKRMEEGIDIPGTFLAEKKGTRSITNALAAYEAVKDKMSAADFISACDVKIGALTESYRAAFPRGEKKAGEEELTERLLDAAALTSGAPVHYLREEK